MKRILITTGGSGGHVIPSLSIYDALKDDYEVQISTDPALRVTADFSVVF